VSPLHALGLRAAHGDHDDDTDMNTTAMPGLTPVRFKAQGKGAAVFDRQEGMWVGPGSARIYFDCTEGGHRTSVRCGSTTRDGKQSS
jgi:secreted PhoX family phosphatase